MDRELLRTIAANRSLRPAELEAAHPDVANAVRDAIAEERLKRIASSVSDAPDAVREAVERVDVSALMTERADVAVHDALAEATLTEAERDAAIAAVSARMLERDDPSIPVALTSTVRTGLAAVELEDVARAARVSPDATARLAERVQSLDTITDGHLAELVDDSTLTEDEAKRMGLMVGLFNATGGETRAAEMLAKSNLGAGGAALTSLRELAGVSAEKIAGILSGSGVEPSDSATVESIAEGVASRLAERFPLEVMIKEGASSAGPGLSDQLRAFAPIAEHQPDAISTPASAIDLSVIPSAERAAAAQSHEALSRLVNLYPGLGIDDAIREGGDPNDVAKAIDTRISLLDKVVSANPDVEILSLDFSPGSESLARLKTEGLTDTERGAVLSTFKAQQRVFALAENPSDTTRLMAAGYHSAVNIAREKFADFSSRSGLAEGKARQIFDKASDTLAGVSVIIGSIIDVVKGGFKDFGVGNLFDDVTDGLRSIDGYADLFGPIDFCHCRHCQSILSPAAYFVDLMYFVEQNVTSKYFSGPRADHAIALKSRRPDLWTLPLTCENTDTLIATLEIVNETFESYIASAVQPAVDLADRAAVSDLVYGQTLAAETESFVMPFVLGQTQSDIYLEAFGLSRLEAARTAGLDEPAVTAASLRVSKAEYDSIVMPRADWPFLRKLYNVEFAFPNAAGPADPLDVQSLLPFSGVNRDTLGAMAASQFVTADGAVAVTIKGEKRSPASVQNDVEKISGLTAEALDRMQRLTRLQRKLPWTIREIDLLLKQRSGAAAPTLDGAALKDLVRVKAIVDRFSFGVEEASALFADIPAIPLVDGQPSLLDRRFNSRPYVLTEGRLPDGGKNFVHPSLLDGAASPGESLLERLTLGLQLSEEALGDLIRELAAPLGANLAAADALDRGFDLTLANLSLLYRHAKLTKLLRRPVGDLFRLLRFAGLAGAISSLDELEQLVAFDEWLRSTTYSLDDLAFATGAPPSVPEKYPDPAAVADAILADVAATNALLFADTVFAFVPGVTESDSRSIVSANQALFEAVPPNMLRLTTDTPPAPNLVIPAGITASLADLQGALSPFHFSNVLPPRIAAQLRTDNARLAALAALAGIKFESQDLGDALTGGNRAPLEQAVSSLARLAVAFEEPVLTPDRLSFIGTHLALFHIADIDALDCGALRSISRYAQLLREASDDPGGPAVQAIDTALAGFTAAQKFGPVAADRMGSALGISETAVPALLDLARSGNDALEGLWQLTRLVAITRDKGVGIEALALVLSDDPTILLRAGEALISALRQLYPDDRDFDSRLQPLEDRLRGLKRDALADRIIRHSDERFETLDDLYAWFLIDPQFEGCARTSRLVAAISSVQAYCHRILLNLEQDRRDVTDPEHVHVLPSAVPADEWSWRKNYRVWEANRKVFLWPENYLEPELRDDKSDLFRTLIEDALLQQDISEQNVLDAYGAYLSGLEEVASLKIAGAVHEMSSGGDVLHLFGCTSEDPPSYYYWTVANPYWSRFRPDRLLSYSTRQKIDVAIGTRAVSPLVHQGRLHLFWNVISTGVTNSVSDGESKFSGYKHKITTNCSTLRLDGRWTSPQSIAMAGSNYVEPGIVAHDPLGHRDGSWGIPLHSPTGEQHSDARDDYTLTGFQWERVFPLTLGKQVIMCSGGLSTLAETDLFDRTQRPLGGSQQSALSASWKLPRRLLHIGYAGSGLNLYMPLVGHFGWGFIVPPLARQALVADVDSCREFFSGWGTWATSIENHLENLNLTPARRGPAVAGLSTPSVDSLAVGNAPGGAGLIIQSARDSEYVYRDGSGIRHMRLGTTVAREMSRILFTGGVNALLDLKTQETLQEDARLVRTPLELIFNVGSKGPIDFKGPMGTYFRETWFEIPFLIADALSSRGKFAAAQGWYHYIFDPMATLDPSIDLTGMTAAQRKKVLLDRVWRYRPFRGLTPPTLRDILSDQSAIRAYKEDPFNPHAIARLRISAYQKAVVMKYVTNLLDWGDHLFRQFQMETVNEALVLYVMALDILGRGPADVGECGEGPVSPRNYENIRPTIDKGSEFLLEVESRYWIGPRADRLSRADLVTASGKRFVDYVRPAAEVQVADRFKVAAVLAETTPINPPQPVETMHNRLDDVARVSSGGLAGVRAGRNRMLREAATSFRDAPAAAAEISRSNFAELAAFPAAKSHIFDRVSHAVGDRAEVAALVDDDQPITRATGWRKTRPVNWVNDARDVRPDFDRDRLRPTFGNDSLIIDDFSRASRFGWSLVRQLGPVFCVPENKELSALWDRANDRLYKIRHCLDINGERRDLALFAPEIDPRLLVRAKAEGLSLDDILGGLNGNLPPYRFTYLIEEARSYAAAVQNFGAQLLAAIERRDNEELTRLRNSQQLDILKLTTRVREWELKIAEEGVTTLERQQAAVEFRRDYYAQLIQTDLLPWERTQQVLRHTATAAYAVGSVMLGTAGVLHLIPQLGSPFAMKYGGKETGDSLTKWGNMLSDTAKMAEVLGASAGLEASFERRREGWEHQRKLAEHELRQLQKQLSAARIRRDIASRAVDLHRKSIEDQDEVIEFFGEKFSNLGLYKWLSTTLQRVYRQSFNGALAIARLAERAFRFERGDEETPLLQDSYWDPSVAGLLAGDRLMADLNDLKRRFIETNYRTRDVDQTFSLLQLDPGQLLSLRETGECEFAIPEVAFDIAYPGHYRRRIRSARLTIACVTGPYTNVSAAMTLKQAFIRSNPEMGAANLVETPLRHTSTIATSTAQNDAGVFDFSFRDERYVPFEGAGAVSVFRIQLPKNFRPFDYSTINDAMISLSYTAMEDGVLREKVEEQNAAIEGTIASVLSETPLPRAISLRQDQSSLFRRLLSSPAGTAVALEIDDRFVPIYLRGRDLNISRALLLVRGGKNAVGDGTKIKVNNKTVSNFTPDPAFPNYRTANIASALAAGLVGKHEISIVSAGDFAPEDAADPAAADAELLTDLAIYVELTI